MAKLRVDKIAAPIVKDEFTGSVFFDGNGDHLDVPLSDDFKFGAGDFTIETWIYLVEAKDQAIFGTNLSSSNQGYELDVFTNGSIRFYSGNGSAYNYGALGLESSAGVVPQQTWTHIVASRQGGTLRLFVNGVLSVSNTSFTHTITDSTIAPDIGNDGRSTGTSYHLHGYISNLRICKGHAVYTGNFTVPTRELPVHTAPPKGVVFPAADNLTVLLACQSSTDATADSSGRHIITAAGNAHAQSANPGLLRRSVTTSGITTTTTDSIWFDGTGDYLATEVSNDFAFGTDDFTFEMWVYYENREAGDTPACLDEVTTTFAPLIGYIENAVGLNGHAVVYISNTGGGWNIASGKTFGLITAKQWHHLAITRSGSDFYLFKDGLLTDSFQSGLPIYQSANKLGFGRIQNIDRFDGYVSNARLIKGKALYTSEFTPPTRELEVTPETVFLGLYDGENIFADKTERHIIAAYGDRLSSPTPTATDSPIGITTETPGLIRNVDPTAGPTFQGGAGFTSQNWLTLPKGTTAERFVEVANNAVSASSARGLFLGGSSPTQRNTIDYITIPTAGDAKDFGDLSASHQYVTSVSSNTRGVNGGGDPTTNIIDYVTISTLGNAKEFGDLFTGRYGTGGCSSGVRGVWSGGFPGSTAVNTIDFVTIASTGNATDFGDLTTGKGYLTGCGSPSRGLFAGGLTPTKINTIEFITIASMGNAFDFGDLTSVRAALSGCSSSTRGVFAGGNTPTMVNIIDYVVIPTTGNAVDFGDQSVTRENVGACSSKTRGVFGGGSDPSNTKLNTIDFVEFATLGDATDFGDLTQNRKGIAGCSNGHGGLG